MSIGNSSITHKFSGKVTKLNDIAGSDAARWKDSDGATVASIDSKGNLRLRGKVMRI